MTLSTSRWAAAFTLVLSLTCACAGTRRESRLRHQLDEHKFQKPLSELWPEALRLVSEQHFEFVGKDRAVVGQSGDSWNPLRRGFETREYSDHRRAAETMTDAEGVRYRVEGQEIEGGGCRIVFFALRRNDPDYEKWSRRDIYLERELVERLEPETAARIEEALK